jgi:hypothetical protein
MRCLLSLSLDWDYILESAFRHGIAPLLYINLRRVNGNHVIPEEVIDRLKKAYFLTTARNMRLYAELSRVLEVFHNEGVEVIVLKGVALAQTVYGNIGLRSMGDIDLLVRKENLSRAKKIMVDLGYVTPMFEYSNEWYNENHFHLPPFFHSENGVKVEIHWHVVKPSKPFHAKMIGRFWERARPIKLANTQVLVLSPEDLLLHLCMHSLNHGFTPKLLLREICDVSEVLKYYEKEFNWIRFQDETDEYGLTRFIHSAFCLIKKTLGNSVTDEVLSQSKPGSIDPKLIEFMERQIFVKDNDSSTVYALLIQLLAVDKLQDKVKILTNKIYPPLETLSRWYSVPSSSKRLYFYYLIRPYKLFLKYWGLFLTNSRLRGLARIYFHSKSKNNNA